MFVVLVCLFFCFLKLPKILFFNVGGQSLCNVGMSGCLQAEVFSNQLRESVVIVPKGNLIELHISLFNGMRINLFFQLVKLYHRWHSPKNFVYSTVLK